MIEVDLMPDETCMHLVQYWKNYFQSDEPSAYVNAITLPARSQFNATARNRYRLAEKSGYSCRILNWEERNWFLDDIHQVNISADVRQGRKMSAGYVDFPTRSSEKQNECPKHRSRFFTVHALNGNLVGYINGCYCGKLAAASQILGHAGHLKNGVMLLLWDFFVSWCCDLGVEHVVYSRWKDGTDGLRYWKHSVGMRPEILKEKK